MKKQIVSILQGDVEALQKVGVPVFKRLGTNLVKSQKYFAEIISNDASLPVAKSPRKERRFKDKTKVRLSNSRPSFARPNSNVVKVYVAVRDVFKQKGKEITKAKLLTYCAKATGLERKQVYCALNDLHNKYDAFEIV